MKKILVTGASGFIGGHLVEFLVKNGYRIRCFVRPQSDLTYLKSLPVEFYLGDILEKESLIKPVSGVDAIIHLSGLIKAKDERLYQLIYSQERKNILVVVLNFILYLYSLIENLLTSRENKLYHLVNTQGTKNLLEVISEKNPGLKKFIFVSSQAAAGASKNSQPLKETDLAKPISHYGKSKLAAEELVKKFSGKFPCVILRPSLVYGPRDKETLIYFRLFKAGWKTVLNRCFSACYVEDFARACLLALEKKVPSGSIYFISDGRSYSIKEINNYLEVCLDFKSTLPIPLISVILRLMTPFLKIFSKGPSIINPDRLSEITAKSWVCDIAKAKTELDYQPKTFLREGLKKTIAWYQKYGWL